MEIENVFEVGAPPDRVYAFLLDVERIVGCVPGAQLVEMVDENTFKGRIRIKVGPITVSYAGNAEIVDRDAEAHTAVLKASGRETTGSGSARATANMSVNPKEGGSEVKFVTDFAVAGRVANFGRGVMEDVSRRLVGQMANCIKANLEGEDASTAEQPGSAATPTPAQPEPPPEQVEAATRVPHPPEPPPAETPAAEALAAEGEAVQSPAPTPPSPPAGLGAPEQSPPESAIPPAAPMGGIAAPATTGAAVTGGPGPTEPAPPSETTETPPAAAPAPRAPATAEAKPINAFSLIFSILGDRIKRLFGGGRS